MAKTKNTILLEEALKKQTEKKRIYGCEEITIGFYKDRYGNEIVDFMSLDFAGIIRCYEIKVSIQDFKSAAHKSWYGNYNYLVITSGLWMEYKDYIKEILPTNIGIIIGEELSCVRKSKYQDIIHEQYQMLLKSMIRSMYYKMRKYYNANNMSKSREKEAEIRRIKKRTIGI